MMRKLLTLLLALILCAGCLPVAAESTPVITDLPTAGLRFTYPQAFLDTKGSIHTDGTILLGEAVYYTYWYYSAVSEEEFQSLFENDFDTLLEKTDLIFYVFTVGNDQDFTIVSDLTGGAFSPEDAILIGELDAWKHYLCFVPNPEYAQRVDQESYDKYTALCGMRDEIIAGFTLSEPFNEYNRKGGTVIRFTATDFNGNPVSSEDLFAQHKITMVNLWATWCGPCVRELKELQAIHTRFLEKDCAIVGLLTDQDVNTARQLLKQNGVDYTVVIAPKDIRSIFPYEGIPTSFFVDSNGAYLGTTITGAYTDQYEPALDSLLAQGN